MVTLTRIRQTEILTLGVLTSEFFRPFYTLERPWQDNRPNVSCVPVGSYRCDSFSSPKFGPTFLLRDVPDRDFIEFHWGSYVHDTEGCILLGTRFIELDADMAMLTGSKVGFREFIDALQSNQVTSFNLEIR